MVLKKVGITGASGMLGRHTLEVFKKKDINIIATSRSKPDDLYNKLTWVTWDLRNWKTPEELDDIFGDPDAIIHIGANVPVSNTIDKKEIYDANVRSCLCLGEWALKREITMIYISGSTVYANPYQKNIVESDEKTIYGMGGFYGFSKLMGENVFRYLQVDGLKLCILRPSSIYGYGLHETKMIRVFLDKASKDEAIELTPPIDDKVDLIHASDLANVILQVVEQEIQGVYNIASGELSSIINIAQTCVEVVGRGKVTVKDAANEHSPKVRFNLNCDAAIKGFNFCPNVLLTEGIKRMWNEIKKKND